MPTVFTITLFPTIDNFLEIEKLEPNIKLATSRPQYFIGGGGLNISKALKKLGINSTSIVLGGGFYQSLFIQLINEEGLEYKLLGNTNSIRENVIITEHHTNREFRLNTPVDSIELTDFDLIINALNQVSSNDFIVISGNSGAGFPESFLQALMELKRKNNFTLIVDTKGKGLKQFFNLEIDFIKPNFEEFLELINQPKYSIEDLIANRTEILKHSKVKSVLVSLGAKGLLYLNQFQHQYFSPIQVESVSSVGAGDSMVAGLIAQLSKNKSIESSIQFGIACGAATTLEKTHLLFNVEKVNELYHSHYL